MKKSFKLAFAAGALALAATSAVAVTSTEFVYSSKQVGVLTIHPMALAPDGSSSAAQSYFTGWSNASTTGDGCFQTAVNLPAGARIASLRVWSQGVIFVSFTGVNLNTGAGTFLFSGDVGDTTGSRVLTIKDITPNPIVGNTFAYGLGVCLEPSESFNGARITYTYTSAGD